jgi:hypothetical protein
MDKDIEKLLNRLSELKAKGSLMVKEITGYKWGEDVSVMPLKKQRALLMDSDNEELRVIRDEVKAIRESDTFIFAMNHTGNEILSYDFNNIGNRLKWIRKLKKLYSTQLRQFIRYHANNVSDRSKFLTELSDFASICGIPAGKVEIIKNECEMLIDRTDPIKEHEVNLSSFTDICLRYKMESGYGVTKDRPFGIFDYKVSNAKDFFNAFCIALRKEVDAPANGKGFEIDIKDRFLHIINEYSTWYEAHKEELKSFEPYNFFDWMYGLMVSTEHEILKYYPKRVTNKKKDPESFEDCFKGGKDKADKFLGIVAEYLDSNGHWKESEKSAAKDIVLFLLNPDIKILKKEVQKTRSLLERVWREQFGENSHKSFPRRSFNPDSLSSTEFDSLKSRFDSVM